MKEFHSILFPDGKTNDQDLVNAPDCLSDLNLDQVINAITSRKGEYQLTPYFYSLLDDVDSVLYRQEVFQDLENQEFFEAINHFAEKMVLVRRYLNLKNKLRDDYHIFGWHLEAAIEYCLGVNNLAEEMSQFTLKSRGLNMFMETLSKYILTSNFSGLQETALQLKSQLKSIQYSLIIKGNLVRVKKYEGEKDYRKKIENVFAKFRHSDAKDYRQLLVDSSGMSHIETQILDCVVKLYPEIFKALEEFSVSYENFETELIRKFDREIQFYCSYLEFIKEIQQSGLSFSFPEFLNEGKSINAKDTFDIALAYKIRWEKEEIVVNDVFLDDEERIIVVSGPNQGGKTTFARMVGQLFYLGCLGCPVPGKNLRLILADGIYTHFEREESIENLQGKLKDDLMRLNNILEQATHKSVIILNEILTSTSHDDAKYISEKVVEKIIQKDALCVCVSFIDELSTLNHKMVSMVSLIDEENSDHRTYKIIRKPADGKAFAILIAKQHGLTYEMIKERINK